MSFSSELSNLSMAVGTPEPQPSGPHFSCLFPHITFASDLGLAVYTFPCTCPSGHLYLQVCIVQGCHMQHPSHAHGSVWLLENPSPGWGTQLSPPQGREARDAPPKVNNCLAGAQDKEGRRKMKQLTFKLLSNPKVLIASCVHLVPMLSV